WFLRAAIQNDPKALTYYGVVCGWGDSSRSSSALWFRCLSRADSLGFLPAKAKYAYRLWVGDGCKLDQEKAEELFQAAVDAGSILGSYVSLGRCMIKGEGIEKDVEAGLELWRGASARGSGEAHLCLYEAYSQGKWVAMDLAKAKEHLEGAANLEEPTG
ncbi:hypothetical protein BJ684DRAFT_2539, partial [Piptocephalis cylindrospora]